MSIGKKIFELRKKKNLSQEELGNLLEVTRQTISKWELEETTPDLKQGKKLANIFNVTLDELVENKTDNVLIEKVNNTEKLAGIIINILKFLGILLILFIVGLSSYFIYNYFNNKNKSNYTDYYYTGRMAYYLSLENINNYVFDVESKDKIDIYVEIENESEFIVAKYLEDIEVSGVVKEDEKMIGLTILLYEEEKNELLKMGFLDNIKIIPTKNNEFYNSKATLVNKNIIQKYIDSKIIEINN